ncbi:UNVERIFIED_ORG: hypothetical protein M2438_001297 [Methylobacterium sp. SuP10 SLI 274]|nr:hypothetical protein [Methylorubrum extorquens]MDF9790802.1 hypothetical protein [Methylorubrum extorquens]MDH6636122.1 hypothetical protein [Methylobacterium sp. SuP10 SLI 274]MDH6665296.1 hypothetical protein [Methylorubrum zatmanii]
METEETYRFQKCRSWLFTPPFSSHVVPPPIRPDVPCLAAYPYVVVRVARPHCPNRTGSYRLARLATRLAQRARSGLPTSP